MPSKQTKIHSATQVLHSQHHDVATPLDNCKGNRKKIDPVKQNDESNPQSSEPSTSYENEDCLALPVGRKRTHYSQYKDTQLKEILKIVGVDTGGFNRNDLLKSCNSYTDLMTSEELTNDLDSEIANISDADSNPPSPLNLGKQTTSSPHIPTDNTQHHRIVFEFHVDTLIGLLDGSKLPPAATPSQNSTTNSAKEPSAPGTDKPLDPCFPYKDRPGHSDVTQQLQIMQRMLKDSSIPSFQPDFAKYHLQ
ncbi:hypothetical protein CROQUDRAFT_133188 [Cronartium quercuum f. sp. fusiforme G11]|uniref:Uncharacterized protein n=1 Tax=Cronartium quercuum f. sp. fusiforme G11 TaxID=708437 RepID=A0A9P6NI15_9BASI|nr:hypothetical protein CROQUDRAFT_133188 [Cronartium quercuum f. sp. fusiforme G11]